MMNHDDLPDIMYFGAANQISELKGQVFLTPHIGIASLFIIDTDDLFREFKGYEISCNLSYRQWSYPNDLLDEPLKKVNVGHNIVDFENRTCSGMSSGYIHVVDVSKVKDKLTLFTTNDPDRELIYSGDEPLPIIQYIPHTLEWDFCFCAEDVKIHGTGTARKLESGRPPQVETF